MTTGTIFNIQKFSLDDGPGIRTTVFFKGCPLRCRWCANPESQNRYFEAAERADAALRGRVVTAAEVLAEVCKDKPFYERSGGGMTLSGGEPLLQAEFALELIRLGHAEGITTAIETTGGVDEARFAAILPEADLFLYDFKHFDPEEHAEGTGVRNDLILQNLCTLIGSGRPYLVRIPVIPRFNNGVSCGRAMARTLAELGVKEVQLLPFHQYGEGKYEQLGAEYAYRGVRPLRPELLEKYKQAYEAEGVKCRF